MKIKKLIVGLLQTNCYLVWDESSRAGIVIDPGGGADKILESLERKKIELQAIIHTHGHRDHTWAANALQKKTGAPIYRHPGEPGGLNFCRPRATDQRTVFDLHGQQELRFGSLQFRVLHTPGHSPGSVSLYTTGGSLDPAPVSILFCGDLLFRDGIGRFDLKGGSFRELVKSLNERLASLPDDTDVLPGHGPATTLGHERRSNPFFHSARQHKRLRPPAENENENHS